MQLKSKIPTKVEEPEIEDEDDVIPTRKRLLKRLSSVIDSDDDEDDDMIIEPSSSTKHEIDDEIPSSRRRRYSFTDDYDYETIKPRVEENKMQIGFQVGCAPEHKQKRCLSWTLYGMIVSTLEDNGVRMIDITLNDSSKTQPKRMTDHFNFTKAALGETGAVFSSEVDEKVPATVFYRPFEAWTSNSEWRVQLDYSEQILGISIGSKFVSVGTDQFNVRILTTGGIQCGLVSLPGPFVCSSAAKDKLAVVYHRSSPFALSQCLGLIVYDYTNK